MESIHDTSSKEYQEEKEGETKVIHLAFLSLPCDMLILHLKQM